VGALQNSDGGPNAGKGYLILGSSLPAPAASSPVTIYLSDADYSFVGEDSSDFACRKVSSAGDVDGDGLDDLLLGARTNGAGGSSAGKAYLILGSSLLPATPPVTIDLSLADHSFVGENVYDSAGASVSSAGDVDGDGFDDLLVGAEGVDSGGVSAGSAYLLLSPY
jgi:hypothetical protein